MLTGAVVPRESQA